MCNSCLYQLQFDHQICSLFLAITNFVFEVSYKKTLSNLHNWVYFYSLFLDLKPQNKQKPQKQINKGILFGFADWNIKEITVFRQMMPSWFCHLVRTFYNTTLPILQKNFPKSMCSMLPGWMKICICITVLFSNLLLQKKFFNLYFQAYSVVQWVKYFSWKLLLYRNWL